MNRCYLNDDWKFTPNYDEQLLQLSYDTRGMQTVRLPHTVKELPFHYFDESGYQTVCGYRRLLYVPPEWEGKHLFLTIEGAAHVAEVYFNGQKLSEHRCGYTAFTTDLASAARIGSDNLLVIKVDSTENPQIPPFGYVVDYMTYGGIYRDVYLDIKEPEYIDDVFVQTSNRAGKSGSWRLSAKLALRCGNKPEGLHIRQTLIRGKHLKQLCDLPVPAKEDAAVFESSKPDMVYHARLEHSITSPELWDVDEPNLYVLRTEYLCGERVLDVKDVRFGFREAVFKKDGFYLNGRRLKLRGLNRHQSYPYVGYAMPESMQKLDADLLKEELGCNAVRTSHYPQSHYFIERCDEIGLLVFMEIPGWQHIGDESWKRQTYTNEREMIKQYRNHTSIILWGVRINESQDDAAFYRETNRIARELDPTRQTGGVRAHKNSQFLEDVYTYNDFLHDGTTPGCELKRNVTPDVDKPYLVSEYNGHMYPSKAFDWEEHRREHALRHANVLNAVAGERDICGSFGWCMFDYNTHKDFGSGDRICYHGVMDMFRNSKLAALVYSCQQEKYPILEISSSMDIGEHPGCNRGATYIFTNAERVKMYKNDVFIKEYTAKDSAYRNLAHGPILIDDFIGNQIADREDFTAKQAHIITKGLNYVAIHGMKIPLKLKLAAAWCMVRYRMKPTDAVALYNKYVGDWGGTSTVYRFEAINKGEVVRTIIKEPMHAIHLDAEISSDVLTERTSYDVAEIRLKVCDENGNQMYFYNDSVFVHVEGPAELIGPSVVPMQGGMSGVYIKSTGRTGTAEITIGNPQVGYVSRTVRTESRKLL